MTNETYELLEDKILDKLERTRYGVLATASKDGSVCAAQMCLINDGFVAYFQSDSKFEKIKNIKENNKVAINLGDYYFKGTAEILGHPTVCPVFVEKLKFKHSKAYDNYTNLKDEVVIKVTLNECKIWRTDNNKFIHEQDSLIVVDLVNKTFDTIICDKM